jgi:hypothetical protein
MLRLEIAGERFQEDNPHHVRVFVDQSESPVGDGTECQVKRDSVGIDPSVRWTQFR